MLLLEAEPVWLALLVTPAISRLTPLLLMRFLPYVTDPTTSKSKPVAEAFSSQRLLLATLFILGVALLFSVWLPALLAVGLVALLWGASLKRQLGGYTGDTLGASVVFTELVLLLGLTL